MYRFVIVDDDDIVCESISSSIDWERFRFDEPIIFSNCADALDYLQNHHTDVVMTNIHIEPISGIELAQQLKEFSEQTLVVFFTESQEFSDAFAAIKLGVFDYILRPATYDQLAELMGKLLTYLDNWPNRTISRDINEGWESIISMAQKYIDDNLCNNIRLESLAEYVHMNPTYFSRYFKKHTNQKLIDYITGQRIKRAVDLMRDPTLKIYNIGYQVGYKNLQHFYKIFKQNTGFTPNEYRKHFYGADDESMDMDE